MKAWLIERHGGNEVLQWTDTQSPEPGPDEARIKVSAVGLNHLDLWLRNGVPGHSFHLPMIPGGDVVGSILQMGPLSEENKFALRTRGLYEGVRVVIDPVLSCGKCLHCLSGFPPVCRQFGMIGETAMGGCAEFINVPVRNLLPLPDSISDEVAAAIPVAYVTAWSMLTRKVRLEPGQVVLVQAGGSGTGVAAIQIAKLFACKVITTVGSEVKAKRVKEIGADYVINYKKGPFRQAVKEALRQMDRGGVDVVVDHVGKDTFAESLKCLTWGGKLVTCGATTGADVSINLNAIFFKNISILGSTMGGREDLIKLLDLVNNQQLRPVIDSVMLMNHLPQALNDLENRKVFGKLVLKFP